MASEPEPEPTWRRTQTGVCGAVGRRSTGRVTWWAPAGTSSSIVVPSESTYERAIGGLRGAPPASPVVSDVMRKVQ